MSQAEAGIKGLTKAAGLDGFDSVDNKRGSVEWSAHRSSHGPTMCGLDRTKGCSVSEKRVSDGENSTLLRLRVGVGVGPAQVIGWTI